MEGNRFHSLSENETNPKCKIGFPTREGGLPCYLHMGLSDFFEAGNSRPGEKEFRLHTDAARARARLVTLTHARDV